MTSKKKSVIDKKIIQESNDATLSETPNSNRASIDESGNIVSALIYVGIGASAGGLEALRPLVSNLPSSANMTYIVAQHMSPDHRSMMVELLARETQLSVEEVKSGQIPQANTVYVAPANTDVTVVKGALRLSKPKNTIGPKPSVDLFFMSLASDQEEHAVGIILSGTGSDGAHGIKAIKAAGGITIAQEPRTAKYDSMPNAAIRIGGADLVLPSHEIAVKLSSIVTHPFTSINENIDPPPSSVRGIVQQIASHTGMDFTNYKDATLSRQIMRRMTAKQIPSLDLYGEYISKHHEELDELAGNFLICVTSFYRDPDSFAALLTTVRALLETKKSGDEIRIWVPGCATGEEVYTITIMLSEILGAHLDNYRVQIFATDINNEAVQIARQGTYPEASLVGVQDSLIEKYFSIQDGMYLISKKLKDLVLFARQDLVQDPPFVRLDMVSCRNLLIYFKPDLQDRVLKIFHYSLRENGVLFLGKSETVGRQSGLFSEKDRRNKIYVKRPIPTPMLGSFANKASKTVLDRDTIDKNSSATTTASTLGHERLYELYTPPSLLVTEDGEIIEFFGDCSPFLSVKKGKADFNLFSLIQPAFRAELRAFFHRVIRNKQSAQGNPVNLILDGKPHSFRIAVHFVQKQNTLDADLLLVSFESIKLVDGNVSTENVGTETTQRIIVLEQEVVLTRENLQTVIEELETANEELQSLNEEAQAANEELQASNEELETANEELQASNEELITVNDELNTRTYELARANDDLNNILNSVYKAVILVDNNLQITRFNQFAQQFFNIQVGMKANIASVQPLCDMPELLNRIQKVLQKGLTDEHEISKGDEHFLIKLTPFILNVNHGIDGVVITIADITEKKLQEEKLRLSASVFEHTSEATMITDANNFIISVNPAFTTITGYTEAEVIGKNPRILSSGLQERDFYKNMWEMILTTGSWKGEIRNKRKNGDLYYEWLSINVLKDSKGKVIRHIGVFSDITESKKALEIIERQANYDSLTDLPNRNLINDRLEQLLLSNRRSKNMFAVLYLDLDNFKAINDALGHAAGDELIIKTASRIRLLIRDVDTVGRMGGDEFTILLNSIHCSEDAANVADKILREIHQPIVIAGHTIQTAASIGITIYPSDGITAETLLKNADNAMYEAKKVSSNTFCFYTHQMQESATKRHWIQQEFSKAFHHRQLELHYQPIIDLKNGKVFGYEALARWRHPIKGLIAPEAFIPIAEQNGTIIDLFEWVIDQSFKDMDSFPENVELSINLSVAQFVSSNHMKKLFELFNRSALVQQNRLTLEITESRKLVDNDDYRTLLHRLKDCGCKIALDDFGTGFSSLSYLKRIPIDTIKIDKSFVRDIMTDEADASMIKAILLMANAFGLKTTAEGVETEDQLKFLRECGCDHAQGFYFCAPVPIRELKHQLGSG